MENYFVSELKQIEREITWLKTAQQKSASVISTVTKSITVTANLWLIITGDSPQAGDYLFYEIIPDNDGLIFPTLDWYAGDITQASTVLPQLTRTIELEQMILPNGNAGVKLTFKGTQGNDSDTEKVVNGHTVQVSANLTVTCTSNFVMRQYEV